MTRLHLPILGLATTMLMSAGFVAHLASAAGDPIRINGGTFEASGVVHVPSTPGVLFVDDGRTREVFWMELNADGSQKSAAVPIPLGADVTDLEGITHDGSSYFVVGSQSKATGFDGDGLVRFDFDAAARRVEHVERIQGLKKWLAANVTQLADAASRIGDAVLNIEGLAWDPTRERLLLGLRAPVVGGDALIVPLRFKDRAAPFRIENLEIDAGGAIRLPLNGAGIRSIEYDVPSSSFHVITGAGSNKGSKEFRIVEWTGTGSTVREVTSYPSRLKPEGITRAIIDGRARTIIVFDTGRFTTLD